MTMTWLMVPYPMFLVPIIQIPIKLKNGADDIRLAQSTLAVLVHEELRRIDTIGKFSFFFSEHRHERSHPMF
jgi:hypothetical protein